MTQLNLFAEQRENLTRVSAAIARHVIAFVNSNEEWFADELRTYVEGKVGKTAPGSSDRILRDLRAKGFINYEVTNRAKSRYRSLEVK